MTFRRFLSFRRKTCCFGRESSEIKQFLFGPILIISHVPSCSIMFHHVPYKQEEYTVSTVIQGSPPEPNGVGICVEPAT